MGASHALDRYRPTRRLATMSIGPLANLLAIHGTAALRERGLRGHQRLFDVLRRVLPDGKQDVIVGVIGARALQDFEMDLLSDFGLDGGGVFPAQQRSSGPPRALSHAAERRRAALWARARLACMRVSPWRPFDAGSPSGARDRVPSTASARSSERYDRSMCGCVTRRLMRGSIALTTELRWPLGRERRGRSYSVRGLATSGRHAACSESSTRPKRGSSALAACDNAPRRAG